HALDRRHAARCDARIAGLRGPERGAHPRAARDAAVPHARGAPAARPAGDGCRRDRAHRRVHDLHRSVPLLPRRAAPAGDGDAPGRMTPKTTTKTLGLALLGLALSLNAARAKPLTPLEVTDVVKIIDDRQRNSGDYRSLAYLEQKEKDKTDTAREAIVYRRSEDQKLMILFTKPKGEAGEGGLRLGKNPWGYDPPTRQWGRRDERERIARTPPRPPAL